MYLTGVAILFGFRGQNYYTLPLLGPVAGNVPILESAVQFGVSVSGSATMPRHIIVAVEMLHFEMNICYRERETNFLRFLQQLAY